MERKEFIKALSGGLGFTCVACMMAACSKDETTTPSNPVGGTGGGGNAGGALITLNLSSELINIGDYASNNDVIVVRLATGNLAASFVAFTNSCPHAGAQLTFVKSSNAFNCSAHGSNFNSNGTLKNGPATSGLLPKTVMISGTTLTVK